jgi:superfamily II DNA or RNA helicase
MVIYNLLKNAVDENTEVYFIAGKTDTEDRETIRKLVDSKTDKRIIIVGSLGTMSTGTSMNKLYHVVFVSPSKSRVTTLQSIGRGLRLDGITNEVTLWDIVDDFRIGKYVNFALKHFLERVKMYDSESFSYKIYNHNL